MIKAVLSNISHPEFGVVSIPLPIPKEQYDSCVELLESLEIGGASNQDCHLDELHCPWPVLNQLEGTQVNLEELDYLAKRLDSFDDGEVAQFQAMAEKLGLTSLKDLINLSFCCQQATVITDFSDLESVGRSHYMNLNGGCASLEELENVDGVESALLLIEGNQGVVTPYGVVYDNGMQLEQIYDGKHFPFYLYDDAVLSLGLISKGQPENTKKATWLYLPATRKQLERGMLRSGIQDPEDMCFQVGSSEFPMEVDVALGSLFDGIGGFPLAAVHNGIIPVWASEIEVFPMEVTKHRFPDMIHVGDITKLHGAELPPVDIICGGSPCQDLSVAGKRAGLSGARSGLFMEQIRIVKEMRNAEKQRHPADLHVRPRFLLWENGVTRS